MCGICPDLMSSPPPPRGKKGRKSYWKALSWTRNYVDILKSCLSCLWHHKIGASYDVLTICPCSLIVLSVLLLLLKPPWICCTQKAHCISVVSSIAKFFLTVTAPGTSAIKLWTRLLTYTYIMCYSVWYLLSQLQSSHIALLCVMQSDI